MYIAFQRLHLSIYEIYIAPLQGNCFRGAPSPDPRENKSFEEPVKRIGQIPCLCYTYPCTQHCMSDGCMSDGCTSVGVYCVSHVRSVISCVRSPRDLCVHVHSLEGTVIMTDTLCTVYLPSGHFTELNPWPHDH